MPADSQVRKRRRLREEERHVLADERYIAELADAVRAQFPACPAERAERIARHTGMRASRRIRRTRAGRALDADAVRLAVIASVRHNDTSYDQPLISGMPRESACERMRNDVDRALADWGG